VVYVLKRLNSVFNRSLAFMASCCLLVLMFLTVGEMVLRFFGTPMAGIVEVVGWLAAATTAFALGYTQLYKGHVAISLLTDKFSPRLQAILGVVVNLSSTVLFTATAWYIFKYAGSLREAGSLSETMKVIDYPWVYMVSLGCLGLASAVLIDLLDSCGQIFTSSKNKG
jgi:TRAP-type C4-dicarboxylate transport system permease small subunit